MNAFQTDILSRRKHYRERRNTIRRFLLVLLFLMAVLLLYFVFKMPNNKQIKIEISRNKLVKNEFILKSTSRQIQGKNFFFISPRILAKNLLVSCCLLRTVVIRKYLYPELSLAVFIKEKGLWGKLESSDGTLRYITDEGDLVSNSYINVSLIPSNLTLVSFRNNNDVSVITLVMLKDILNFFDSRLKIKVNKFFITDKNTLEIYTDNSMKINAGYINSKLFDKITKLSSILSQVRKKSYLIQYIDLSLERGAVIKKKENHKDKQP